MSAENNTQRAERITVDASAFDVENDAGDCSFCNALSEGAAPLTLHFRGRRWWLASVDWCLYQYPDGSHDLAGVTYRSGLDELCIEND